MQIQTPSMRPGAARFRRPLLLTLAILLIVLALTPPALAGKESGPIRFGEKIDVVGGAWFKTTPNTFSDLTIRVFDRSERSSATGNQKTDGPGLTLFYVLLETDPVTNDVTRTEYEGFVPSQDARFVFNPSFKDASADFDVELYGYRCIDGGAQGVNGECVELDPVTVNVDLEWKGFGEITKDSDSDSFNFPGFKFHSHMVQSYRSAELTGTVSGGGLTLADGPASFGVMLRGKYHESLMVK